VSQGILPELSLAIVQPFIFVAGAMAMLALAAGGWSGLSRLRAWGHLVSGAWLSVAVSFLAEVVLVGGLAAIVLMVLSVIAPDQARQILFILRTFDRFSLQDILDIAMQPWAAVLTFAVAACLIPIVEELLKPIGVILLLGRRPVPMAAFLGGVMGGLGFAITETLSNLATINDPWFVLVLARMGTLAMHGLTAGIAGWGWGQLAGRRPLRFFGAFASAVFLHGLWNGCVVVIVFASLYLTQNSDPGPQAILLVVFVAVAALLLLMLVPACLLALGLIGYRLRSTAQ
jgi:RsiW-degrading membrane proteinase PrsW (M82 family)